ncbi:MAG TPA: hypothetical protein DIS90_14240 [Cytophagales bacterium]|nr:hypothetical protein [Cytophagales bacterium]
MQKLLVSIIIFGLITGCSSDDNIAKDRIYYFTITSRSDRSTDLVDYLIKNMHNKRVAITNQSGSEWPFYEVLATTQELSLDSLMPPHYYVHLLKEKKEQEIQIGEFYIEIKVMLLPDTLANYELDIYKMDTLGLIRTAKTGIHFIEKPTITKSDSAYDILLKSIIRYSFK